MSRCLSSDFGHICRDTMCENKFANARLDSFFKPMDLLTRSCLPKKTLLTKFQPTAVLVRTWDGREGRLNTHGTENDHESTLATRRLPSSFRWDRRPSAQVYGQDFQDVHRPGLGAFAQSNPAPMTLQQRRNLARMQGQDGRIAFPQSGQRRIRHAGPLHQFRIRIRSSATSWRVSRRTANDN